VRILFSYIILFLFLSCNKLGDNNSWIRINYLGYLPNDFKNAVFVSKSVKEISSFSIINASDNKVHLNSDSIIFKGAYGPFSNTYRLNFTSFKKPGKYYIKVNNIKSEVFTIGEDIYDDTADFLLKYMRQQRCGFNPFLNEYCHQNDGFITYHPSKNGEYLDVSGGWHDATDYLQYSTTSANAIYQMSLAFDENPQSFSDNYKKNGLNGKNGIPDVIDEIKFGVDWLLKMNPSNKEFYNQIADDRDHAGYRLPHKDKVVYDSLYKGRPVYFINGEKQGLGKFKNNSNGKASTVAKFASSYAKASKVLFKFYPDYSRDILKKGIKAYEFAKDYPGVSQTAPHKAPYYYEEENWIDDMELAAATLYEITKENMYKKDAIAYSEKEKISPWIGKETLRHYQFYPFVNTGHYQGAKNFDFENKTKLFSYYDKGLDIIFQKAKENPFFYGIPFVWCSNNYVAAILTQSKLYNKLSKDDKYLEMETSLRDWLFGCNPWGKSMIVDLPSNDFSSQNPHSSLWVLEEYQTRGGLVDGPVYGSIFNNLIGIELYNEDKLKQFQSDLVVYHDDAGDYSTNEPTMDGTASLIYYLSSLNNLVD
jgi:endoglucanase